MNEDKLSLLARKEEELRKLNEQLTLKQRQIEAESPAGDSDDKASDREQEDDFRPDMDEEMHEPKHELKESAKDNDEEFEQNLLEVKKYQEVAERCNEYERTIALQKAKIATLEVELQNAISNMNAKDLQISELESKDKSLSDQSKKYTTQINQLNVSIQKLKQQNEDYYNKIEGLEKTIAQQRQDINKSSQTHAKVTQESHNKDVK
eukprot:TRINITY_DN4544_c0_g2_i2.p3 TRINITY_DN4544_c0_g2~~TRINITY_DN4544_c0_g2_i2.p3  ORF type:complete len:207 (+),score=74.19 TRINITY_DN4544_c0_g2_i2:1543-2163(+)